MSTRQGPSITFIHHSHQDGKNNTTKSQRQIHAHAARVAHARVRISRMRNYRKQMAGASPINDDSDSNDAEGLIRSGMTVLAPDVVSHKAYVLPSPVSLLSSDRRDPFGCFVVPLKPMEHFLLDHYVKVVVPSIHSTCFWLKQIESAYRCMVKNWTHFALRDRGLLHGLLLSACRRLDSSGQYNPVYSELATRYKLECVRFVIDAIADGTPDMNATFIRIITLAFDEMYVGDVAMFEHHMHGAIKLVCMMGGPQMLRLDGLLEAMYQVGLTMYQVSTDLKCGIRDGVAPCTVLNAGF